MAIQASNILVLKESIVVVCETMSVEQDKDRDDSEYEIYFL